MSVQPSALSQAQVDRHWTRAVLKASLWGLLGWAVTCGAAVMVVATDDPAEVIASVLVYGSLALGALVGQWLLHSERLQITGQLLVGLMYVGFTVIGALWGVPVFPLYVLFVLTSSLVLGRDAALVAGALSIASGLSVSIVTTVVSAPAGSVWLRWAGDVLALVWAAGLAYLAAGRWKGVPSRTRDREQAAGAQAPGHNDSGRLAEARRHSEQLRALIKIAQDTSGLVDEDELLGRSAELVRRTFSFQEVCIYLVEPIGEQLGLRARAVADSASRAHREPAVGLDEGSVVSVAFRTGRPALSSEDWASAVGTGAMPEGRVSHMAYPLRLDGDTVGVLGLHSATALPPSSDRDDTFQLLADQVATAIHTARAFSVLQQRAVEARAEHRTSATEEWHRILRARQARAMVRNERGLHEAQDLWQPQMDVVVESGELVFGESDERVMVVPITVRDSVIAVLSARKPQDARPWSYQEVALVRSLCTQLGQALENARLYESVRQREEQARVLGQSTARMRESLDVETVLQVAAEEIRDALGLAALDVRLQLDGQADRPPVGTSGVE